MREAGGRANSSLATHCLCQVTSEVWEVGLAPQRAAENLGQAAVAPTGQGHRGRSRVFSPSLPQPPASIFPSPTMSLGPPFWDSGWGHTLAHLYGSVEVQRLSPGPLRHRD